MSAEFNKTTLKNGLRIITVPKPDSPSATAMVLVGVGSRHESSRLAGISHFIEHNVFKATKNRPRRNQVTEEIEGLGGVTNAATGHDFTYYWAKAAASQAEKILDLVMDISLNMTFPEKDLEIERGNVIEEINMYQDNPPGRLLQDFVEFVWGGHPVGRRILGTKDTIRGITRRQMLEFVKGNYTPKRLVVVVAGAINEGAIVKQVERFYKSRRSYKSSEGGKKFEEFQTTPRIHLDTDKTQQTHLCLGVRSFSRQDDRRYGLDLLNAILGQGLSSRLFKKIRDELGLAYYVGSENWELADTGLWFARAGVDTSRAEEALEAILVEFQSLALHKVGPTELRKAKEFVKGKTLLAVETSDALGGWYGFLELFEEERLSPEEYNQRIDALTAAELRDTAADVLRNERLNLGVVGPFKDKEKFEEILSLEH